MGLGIIPVTLVTLDGQSRCPYALALPQEFLPSQISHETGGVTKFESTEAAVKVSSNSTF